MPGTTKYDCPFFALFLPTKINRKQTSTDLTCPPHDMYTALTYVHPTTPENIRVQQNWPPKTGPIENMMNILRKKTMILLQTEVSKPKTGPMENMINKTK